MQKKFCKRSKKAPENTGALLKTHYFKFFNYFKCFFSIATISLTRRSWRSPSISAPI